MIEFVEVYVFLGLVLYLTGMDFPKVFSQVHHIFSENLGETMGNNLNPCFPYHFPTFSQPKRSQRIQKSHRRGPIPTAGPPSDLDLGRGCGPAAGPGHPGHPGRPGRGGRLSDLESQNKYGENNW